MFVLADKKKQKHFKVTDLESNGGIFSRNFTLKRLILQKYTLQLMLSCSDGALKRGLGFCPFIFKSFFLEVI